MLKEEGQGRVLAELAKRLGEPVDEELLDIAAYCQRISGSGH